MFESFKKIIVKGGCFDSETELELFQKDPLSIVYGRNGSGKTTIAHSIAELAKSAEERSSDYLISSVAVVPDVKKHSIYVFDEDFVRDQVRVEKDGINAIVMLGEQVELDDQINQKNEKRDELVNQLNELADKQNQYSDETDPISPRYVFNQIRNVLRQDNGWADIDRDLKGNTLKSKITDDVISALMGIEEPEDSVAQIRERVIKDLNLYRKSESANTIEWAGVDIGLPDTLEPIIGLLTKPLDAPALSEREQRLLSLLASHPQHSVQETKQMIEEGWEFCPLCFREINDNDKTTIEETLGHVLNKKAEEYERELDTALELFSNLEPVLPEFGSGLYDKEINAALTTCITINRVLEGVREKILLRKKSIFESLKEPFDVVFCSSYCTALNEWRTAMTELKKCVDRFNESVSKRKQLFEQVRDGNNLLARKENSILFQSYRKAIDNSHLNSEALGAKNLEVQNVEQEINALKALKERTDIALDYINHELQYVFYSNRKVILEPGPGCYKLKVNGRNVRPNRISVGERNILGLCYFFAKLFNGKTGSSKYSEEYLIVIDDPVSSFDYGNRIGVMSLLRYQFDSILKGNANSRILVMSHDLHSVFDLVKIRNEVVPGRHPDKSFMELRHNQLGVTFKQNEYKKLLVSVFEYAVDAGTDDPDEKSELGIGNIMRRMLEAFSSFCYNDTFEKMLRNESVLASIPPEKKSYYESFMGRLTLNGESHMEESVYTLETMTSFFTREEKAQTAKSILLFLLYINKPHLASYLEDAQLAVIEGWKVEEEGWLLATPIAG